MPSPISAIHSRMCSKANRMPRAAVIRVQRKAPDLSPALAALYSKQHGQAAGQQDEGHDGQL